MKIISSMVWGTLKCFGISRAEDLPPIPDAPAVKTPQQKTPNMFGSDKKHVTFSPDREFIPLYQFDNSKDPALTPSRLLSELQQITDKPEAQQKVELLVKMVDDLRDELFDLQQENNRLVRENKYLRTNKETKSPKKVSLQPDSQPAVNCQ